MTKTEYAAYVSRFEDGIKGYTHFTTDGEEYFSWRRCSICGTTEGGSREDGQAVDSKSDAIVFVGSICLDCVYFNEYGRLDDMTMMEVEEGE